VTSEIYGYTGADLGDQAERLARALQVEWVEHQSDYRGAYLMARPRSGTGRLRLQSNDLRDAGGEYLQDPSHPECRYLLFVDNFENLDEVRNRLAALPQWQLF
jgi:hypothetical protein